MSNESSAKTEATPTSSTQASSTDDKEQTPAQANRNDNSNPQQGNGKNIEGGAENLVKEDTKSPAPVWAPSNLRPSLKIPPTAKDERKLFVGGLPGNITNEELLAFFEEFGQVMDSIVMFDYNTGRSRGFGFVTFEDPAVARHLLSLGHEHNTGPNPEKTGRIQLGNKLIEIKAAEPKPGRGHSSRTNRHKARNVPEAYPVADESAVPMMAPYGQAYPSFYPYPVAGYGAAAPPYTVPMTPYPAELVQGYVTPFYYPPPNYETPVPFAPAVIPPPETAPGTPFAGYAFIPHVPAPPTAPSPHTPEHA